VAAAAEAAVAAAEVVAVAAAVDVDKEKMMTNHNSSLARRSRSALAGLAFAALLAFPLASLAADQQTFASPDDAVAALIAACKVNDDAALVALFGEKHKHLVVSSDRAESLAARAKACAALQAYYVLDETAPNRRVLMIGEQAWPLPIPLVRENGAWRFATELGEDEIIARRIGANERDAITVLRAYLDAQRQYASVDRNGDAVFEYAQKLASSPGQHDGLYWPADPAKGEEQSPFGPLVAASTQQLEGRRAGDPFRGYHFRILTRQGKSAPGGAFSYVINGRMIAGFAMIAYPAEYGVDGVMTFIVSNSGIIFEKNLGAQTAKAAKLIKEFNPDASWKRVSDPLAARGN
jgi:hypothetical protein